MKKNKRIIGLLLLIPLLLLFSKAIADKFDTYALRDGTLRVQWSDSVGLYNTADTADFDGSGSDDMGVTKKVTYNGGADSIITVKIFSANYTQNDTAVSEGADDLVFRGTYAGTADSFFAAIVLTANYTKNDTAAIDADTAGLNDVTISGTYAGTADSAWCVQILDVGHDPVADTIKFGRILGADTASITWTDTAVLDAAPDSIEVGDGIFFIFADSTGHTTDDKWSFYGYGYRGDSIAWISDAGADTSSMDYTDTMILVNDSVQVGAAIYLVWDSIAGHDVGDIEVFKVYGYWADSIMWAIDSGFTAASHDSMFDGDTVAIDADSNAITTGEVYVVFDSIAGHTVDDQWTINLYQLEDHRDTLYSHGDSSWFIDIPFTFVQWRHAITFPTATNDSMICVLQHKPEGGSWVTLKTDTLAATSVAVSNWAKDTLTLGPFFRSIYYLLGEECDTSNYTIKDYLDCW